MSKKVVKRSKNIKKNQSIDDDKFSFDNEIVIGVTKVNEPAKKTNKKVKKNKIKNKDKSTKKTKRENEKEYVKQKITKKPKRKEENKNRKINLEKEKKIEQSNKKIKKKRKINKRIVKFIAILSLFIILVICAMFSPLFNIKNIQVNGNELLTKEQIISLSKIQKGQNTFKINKGKTKQNIKENVYIESVKISRKLPSDIIIQIEERKPEYLLEYASSYITIDKNGYILEVSSEKAELPILQGTETSTENLTVGNRLCIEDLKKLVIIEKIMQVAKDNELNSIITRINIENEKNIQLIFEEKEITAHLGDDSNLNTKILTIKAILEKVEGKQGEIFVNMDLNKENPIFRQRV